MSEVTERRRHVLYRTLNSEYHCRDGECVGVFDRATGRWYRKHPALRARLQGDESAVNVGMRLCFRGVLSVRTSRVIGIARPDADALDGYLNRCWSGLIELSAHGASREHLA